MDMPLCHSPPGKKKGEKKKKGQNFTRKKAPKKKNKKKGKKIFSNYLIRWFCPILVKGLGADIADGTQDPAGCDF